MANFIAFYLEVVIPHLERAIVDLQDKLENPDCDSNILLDDNSEMVTLAIQPNLTETKYKIFQKVRRYFEEK